MRRTFLIGLFTLMALSLYAQFENNSCEYRRSALATLWIWHPEDTFGIEIYRSFDSLPSVDTYENITVPDIRFIDNSTVQGIQSGAAGYYKADYLHALSDREVLANAEYTEDLLNRTGVGKTLLAQTTAPAFVLVHDITYVAPAQRVETDKVSIKRLGGLLDAFAGARAKKTLARPNGEAADGSADFKIKTYSYLYRLDPINCRLQYVGCTYDFREKASLKGLYTRTELVRTLCARSIDKNTVELGKQYDDFQAKTPVYQVLCDNKGRVLGYAVKIGTKEGVNDNSKFLVVQPVTDPRTNKTTYRYVAAIKPVKDAIWDNRYNADREQTVGSDLLYTTFKRMGGGDIQPGMLLIDGRNAQLVN